MAQTGSETGRQGVAYLRVSTREQGKSGLGIEAQRAAIARFAEAEGFTIIAEYVECETGKGHDALERRPQLAAALAHAKKAKGRVPVIMSKVCRFARSVAFVSGIMAKGVPFIITELGMNADDFTIHIHVSLAERERKRIGDNTKEALAAKKARGETLGNKTNLPEAQAKGAAVNRTKADAFAANVLPVIRQIQGSGATTLRQIAEELNRRRIRTARDGAWAAQTVRGILAKAGP